MSPGALTVARGCGHAPGGTWERAVPVHASTAAATHAARVEMPFAEPGKFRATISPVIQITVNGSTRALEHSLDVAALLTALELTGKKVAVERNGEIVPRSAHGSTQVLNGDRLEIVVAVGGG